MDVVRIVIASTVPLTLLIVTTSPTVRFLAPEEQTGNDVFDQRLRTEGDRNTDNSDGSKDGAHINPEQIQHNAMTMAKNMM